MHVYAFMYMQVYMYMYMCIYIYTYIYIHIYVYVHVYACVHMYMHLNMYVSADERRMCAVHARTHAYMYTDADVCCSTACLYVFVPRTDGSIHALQKPGLGRLCAWLHRCDLHLALSFGLFVLRCAHSGALALPTKTPPWFVFLRQEKPCYV